VALPLLHLDGTPYEQGLQHGRALRDLIAENLAVYFDRFEREGKLQPAEARERANRYVPVLEEHAYFEAMRGVADGSGVPFQDIVVLNMRYELLYFQYGVNALVDGCTSFAVLPRASLNGHLLLGQNWDWIPEVRGAVLHTRDADGLETLGFTEAGIVGGKIGLNSVGLGLAINGLYTTADDWSRLKTPFHVRCYDILRSRTLEQAMAVVSDTPRACSTNFLIAQTPDRALDLEAAPDTITRIEPSDTALVHSNHFIDPAASGVDEPPVEKRPHSYSRQARMQELLDARAPVSIADLEEALRDHDNFPDSLCRHVNTDDEPEEWVTTVTSAIMDLQERSLRLTAGQPCEHLYETYSIAHSAVLGR
jgi:isopenicillin-N N-acyltransferase-like protein